MANTEDIEARLCAYVDGELDDAARAEIERHLTSNPQHRLLLGELTQSRDFLRQLPRETAPIDMLENLQAQLERAALLGDSAGEAERIVRIGHWSQLRAIAAVLVLAAGLGAVLYYMLPSPHSPSPEVALSLPEAGRVHQPDRAPLAPTVSGRVLVHQGTPDELRPRKIEAALQEHPLLALGNPSHGPGHEAVTNAVPVADEIFAQALGYSGAVDSKTESQAVPVEVISPDPAAAAQQIRQYLLSNSFQFDSSASEPSPAPLRLEQSQIAMSSKSQQRIVMLKNGPAVAEKDKDEAAAAGGNPTEDHSLARSGSIDPSSPEFSFVVRRQMSRADVALMCDALSDAAAGRIVRVYTRPPTPRRELSLYLLPQFLRDAKKDEDRRSSNPVRIDSTDVVSTETKPGASSITIDPATNLPLPIFGPLLGAEHGQSDERVDVVIVIRSEPDASSPSTSPAEPIFPR